MRLLGLSFVSFLLCAAAQEDFDFSGCSTKDADVKKCAQKMDAVVEVTPGTLYFSKIACKDCPYAETWNEDSDDGKPESRMTHGDQELFFNVTLANDTRSVLLNGKKIFPVLKTIPNPPHIAVPLLHPNFSYKNLTAATTCPDPTCTSSTISSNCTDWCQSLPLARMLADYSYAAHIKREEADAQIRFWDIIFDPVGGHSAASAQKSGSSESWKLDDTDRKALHIVIAGQPIKRGNKPRPHNSDDGGLFGPVGADEIYSLSITTVEQVVRRFDFASPSLSLFARIRRFFGGDVWKSEGELVYLSEEWGAWGKKGTLRNWVGEVFHSNFLGLFFIIIGSIVGGFIALRVVQSVWLWAKTQRSLASWKGIDAVYSQLNQRGNGNEERWDEREGSEANFHGDYRDSYDEGPSQPLRASMGWHEERMKPLPTKPLPEKPLPQEPLIDT